MSYQIIFRPEARDEAIESASYIAEHSSADIALQWYEGLKNAIESLSTMPLRCPLARENDAFPGVELRQIIFRSHRLIFTVKQRTVHILHIRHSARDDIEDL